MQRKTIRKEVPEVGDKIKAYVTHPLVTITGVRAYTGRYTQWFSHFIKYYSPICNKEIEGCWPVGGEWVYLDELESE